MTPLKILLVDDVELFLKVEKTFFQRENVELLVARSGREAVAMVQAERPHLVFMDLYMPEMNGDQACRIIKTDSHLRSIPVIMVAGSDRPEDILRCKDSRCDDVIHKPVSQRAFLDTARKYLGVATRTATRIEARLEISYGLGADRLLSHYSINISTGGLFLETPEPLPSETPLILEFTLPDRPAPIRCRGRVAWVNPPDHPKKQELPPGMGIQFINLALADMQLIRDFIKSDDLSPHW